VEIRVYIEKEGAIMNRNRLGFMLKGTARLLDIGSSINRKTNDKTIAEEAREIIAHANYIVSSVLFLNINGQIKKHHITNEDGKQKTVTEKLNTIREGVANMEKKIERIMRNSL
jgi:hypothetical protein